MKSHFRLIGFFLFLGLGQGLAWGAPSEPYFVSLKNEITNMREGPSEKNRLKWVYHRKGLPLEVLASYEAWRRVRDMDGEVGWVHTALLSRDRSVLVIGQGKAPVRARADLKSRLAAEAEPGAIGKLYSCEMEACDVGFDGIRGWVARARLWGVHDGD